MEFELISRINEIETIAFNRGIHELSRLQKLCCMEKDDSVN